MNGVNCKCTCSRVWQTMEDHARSTLFDVLDTQMSGQTMQHCSYPWMLTLAQLASENVHKEHRNHTNKRELGCRYGMRNASRNPSLRDGEEGSLELSVELAQTSKLASATPSTLAQILFHLPSIYHLKDGFRRGRSFHCCRPPAAYLGSETSLVIIMLSPQHILYHNT